MSGGSSVSSLSDDIKSRLRWEKIEEIVPVIPSVKEWENPNDASRIALGCFTDEGEWSQKRDECAADQRPFVEQLTIEGRTDDDSGASSSRSVSSAAVSSMRPDATPEEREVQYDTPVRAAIDEEFLTREERVKKIDTLRSSILDAVASLSRIGQSSVLTTAAKTEVADNILGLRQLLLNIDAATVTDVDARIIQAQDRITAATLAAKKGTNPLTAGVRVPTDAEMAGVLAKLDRIVNAAPKAHEYIASQKFVITASATEALKNARTTLQKTRDSCSTLARCPSLPDTVTALEQWRDSMRQIVGSREDLLQKIDALISGE